MPIQPIYRPTPDRPLRVGAFMSGSGTNLVKILEHERAFAARGAVSPYRVGVVFTDNENSNAERIAGRYGLEYIVNDIMAFYRGRGYCNKRDLTLRPDFDALTVALLGCRHLDVIALTGYMSIVTEPLWPRTPDAFSTSIPRTCVFRKRAGESTWAPPPSRWRSSPANARYVRRCMWYEKPWTGAKSSPCPARWT
ncbi:MAG: hypothetical protein M5R36_03850 [Deltaproteobacteria bacterium]|nr:hypothetical protein [Deltaproteobacteria bacterium]